MVLKGSTWLQAILSATKSSFAAMKKRLGGISTSGGVSAERPFFDVSVELSVPRVTMNPTLDDIQAAINATAKKVICKPLQLHYICMSSQQNQNCGNLAVMQWLLDLQKKYSSSR